MRRGVLVALLVASEWALAETSAPVFVFVGLSEPAVVEQAGTNEVLVAVSSFLDDEDIADRNSAEALEAARWTGFDDAVLERFGCFGGGPESCRTTTLVVPGLNKTREQSGKLAADDGPLAAVVAQLFVDTQPIARVSLLKRRSKGRFGRISRLNIQYFDPPEMTEDEAAYPFYADPDQITDEERQTLAASRALWFEGDPSPLGSVVQGFVAAVPRVLDHVYRDLATQAKPFDLRSWYAGLKPIKAYAKAHDFDCRSNDCSTRLLYIDADAGQAWLARYYDSDLVVRVVPCQWLWCDAD